MIQAKDLSLFSKERIHPKFFGGEFVRELIIRLAALVILILCLPIALLVAAGIFLDSPGPVFFIQKRMGKNQKIFSLCKFRTLYHQHRSPDGAVLLAQDYRITHLGKLLRPSGLDEIPQLWNILTGDMRFVGPRPTLPQDINHYNVFQKKRFQVKPGLTGMVAICGGHHLTWPQRIRLDVWYVRHQSFWLDLWIIWKTILLLIKGRPLVGKKGISEEFIPKHV